MKRHINLWSFIFAFVCLGLFFLAISTREIIDIMMNLLHLHPLHIVLILSLITCLLGVIGFAGITNWWTMLRSITTVVLSLGLSVVILIIVICGGIFKFT